MRTLVELLVEVRDLSEHALADLAAHNGGARGVEDELIELGLEVDGALGAPLAEEVRRLGHEAGHVRVQSRALERRCEQAELLRPDLYRACLGAV